MSDAIRMIAQTLISILAAYLSAKWAVKRTLREKLWDRKVEAYSNLVDALYNIIRYSHIRADETYRFRDPDHKEAVLKDEYYIAYEKVMKATDIGAFIISDEAAKVLEELRERPRLDWEHNPDFDIYFEEERYFKDALSKIKFCARKELGN